MNKKGFTDTALLNLIKIGIISIVGYIIIKAILSISDGNDIECVKCCSEVIRLK